MEKDSGKPIIESIIPRLHSNSIHSSIARTLGNMQLNATIDCVHLANTTTALISLYLIFHKFTTWTLFVILFSRIRINIRPFKVGNSYYLEY